MLFVYADAVYENGIGFGHGYTPDKNINEQLGYGDGYGEIVCTGSGSGILHDSNSTCGYGHGVGDGLSYSSFTGRGNGLTGAGRVWPVTSKGAYGYGVGDQNGGGNGDFSGVSDVERGDYVR